MKTTELKEYNISEQIVDDVVYYEVKAMFTSPSYQNPAIPFVKQKTVEKLTETLAKALEEAKDQVEEKGVVNTITKVLGQFSQELSNEHDVPVTYTDINGMRVICAKPE